LRSIDCSVIITLVLKSKMIAEAAFVEVHYEVKEIGNGQAVILLMQQIAQHSTLKNGSRRDSIKRKERLESILSEISKGFQ